MFSLIIDLSWPKNLESEKQLLSNRKTIMVYWSLEFPPFLHPSFLLSPSPAPFLSPLFFSFKYYYNSFQIHQSHVWFLTIYVAEDPVTMHWLIYQRQLVRLVIRVLLGLAMANSTIMSIEKCLSVCAISLGFLNKIV